MATVSISDVQGALRAFTRLAMLADAATFYFASGELAVRGLERARAVGFELVFDGAEGDAAISIELKLLAQMLVGAWALTFTVEGDVLHVDTGSLRYAQPAVRVERQAYVKPAAVMSTHVETRRMQPIVRSVAAAGETCTLTVNGPTLVFEVDGRTWTLARPPARGDFRWSARLSTAYLGKLLGGRQFQAVVLEVAAGRPILGVAYPMPRGRLSFWLGDCG